MKAKAILKSIRTNLDGLWKSFHTQTSGFTGPTVVALIVCLLAGTTLQQQSDEQTKADQLMSRGPAHQRLTDWTAEFYSCPNDGIEKQCKRVLQRHQNGHYVVASERLPLGHGRFVSDSQFSTRPTHVRLSHRILDQEDQRLQRDWAKEKPVLAMIGFPVCEGTRCQMQDMVVPMNRITVGDKDWIQFDSPVHSDGQFGPQTLPPLLVAQAQAHHIFSILTENRNAFFLEFGLAVLAPLMSILLTLWLGKPSIYVALTQFLVARALWTVVAADTLMQQTNILGQFSIKGSFALSAFLSGWVFAAALNFLSVAWSQKELSRRAINSIGSAFALFALLSTYSVDPQSPSAVVTLRAFEFVIALSSALLTATAYLALKKRNWSNRVAEVLRNSWKPEEGARWELQMKGLLFSFVMFSCIGLWVLVESMSHPFTFNWGAVLTPCLLACVLLNSRPQLTPADVQVQKDHIEQQEALVKLLSQLGGVRHRGQAVSLVVNFCNRELPRLGFETPQFHDNQNEDIALNNDDLHEVLVRSPVRTTHQTFGWIVARAQKRTERTAMGERMIEALSHALAIQLNTIGRVAQLESEATCAQKFVPRELARFFGITTLEQINVAQEYRFSGTVVSVLLRMPQPRGRELEGAPERGIINELTALFLKTTADCGGYLVTQEGLKWTFIFRDTSAVALNWIETTQVALRNWNQSRSLLSIPTYDCSFGAQVSTLTLSFSERAGSLRSWIQFDPQGVATMLAEAASDYNASALLSQDYVTLLASGRGTGSLPDAVRPLDKIWNRSKTATLDVFEFFGGEPDLRRAAKQKTVETFSEGVRAFHDGQFDAALSAIRKVADLDPHDKAAQHLLNTLSHHDTLKAA